MLLRRAWGYRDTSGPQVLGFDDSMATTAVFGGTEDSAEVPCPVKGGLAEYMIPIITIVLAGQRIAVARRELSN